MNTFLSLVAQDLLRRKIDLSQTTLVFPGKRAVTFFNEALFEAAGQKPLWSPRYTTINELFTSLSPLTKADPIDCVCRIYAQYVQATGEDVTLDAFYGWGERLLKDFDDIDKNLDLKLQARQIFDNLKDLNELQSLDYLTPEQQKTLAEFFRDFTPEMDSEIQRRFLKLWHALNAIYDGLRDGLKNDGLAYEGMLMRDVMTNPETPEFKGTFVFVGHNVLSNVEKELLKKCQRETQTLFYWDYDVSYMENGLEAGKFLRANMKDFPNALEESQFDNIRKNTIDVEFVSATSNTQQARSVTTWTEERMDTERPTKTAIVLADEQLLFPVLHSLPQKVENVNITNGYMLQYSNVFTEAEDLLKNVKENANAEQILTSLQDRMVRLDEDDTTNGSVLSQEARFLVITICNRLQNLLKATSLKTLSTESFKKLLRMVLSQESIPFSGEPAMGLQIMGMLETRCLDFDNVLILSCNEKILPAAVTHNSFIPFNLRRAFGLTLPIHRTALSAYYFYRLFQRAKHVRCVYNCSTNNNGTGEMSRFMMQMMVEMPELKIKHVALTTPSRIVTKIPPTKSTPDDIAERIKKLSPSALNTYVQCPLRFYFQKIERLAEPQEETGVLQANDFGTIFHETAEAAYKLMAGGETGTITKQRLQELQNDDAQLDTLVKKTYTDYLAHECKDKTVKYSVIVASAIKKYLKRVLKYDEDFAPIELLGTEINGERRLKGRNFDILVHGNIDRLETATKDGERFLRVVDYKSGKLKNENCKEFSQIFSDEKFGYVLQTFLYSYVMTPEHGKDGRVQPQLIFLQDLNAEPIKLGDVTVSDFRPLEESYEAGLTKLIEEIFDKDIDFTPRVNDDKCKNCPYQLLCFGRKVK